MHTRLDGANCAHTHTHTLTPHLEKKKLSRVVHATVVVNWNSKTLRCFLSCPFFFSENPVKSFGSLHYTAHDGLHEGVQRESAIKDTTTHTQSTFTRDLCNRMDDGTRAGSEAASVSGYRKWMSMDSDLPLSLSFITATHFQSSLEIACSIASDFWKMSDVRRTYTDQWST